MQEKDFLYFIEHQKEFFERYGHKFLAIKDEKVLGTFDTALSALKETAKTEELGTFIIQECTGDASAYTVYINTPVVLA